MTAASGLAAWLRLTLIPGIGGESQRKLLAAFGLPEQIFAAGRLAVRGVVGERADLLFDTEVAATVDAALAWSEKPGHTILTLADPDYPPALLEVPDPPTVLYLRGDPRLLTGPGIAIVGSRNATAGGIRTAAAFATALAGHGLTVISGLALGIDAAAHRGALAGAGATLAVIGTGIDRIYPARNRDLALAIAEKGLVVSEFPLGTPPLAANFPRRNRVISGLSRGVLVVEAALQSGSLITARLAAEQGREVFAVPGSIHSPVAKGCHRLIREGAKLVETAADILEELGIEGSLQPTAALQTDQETSDPILAALGHDPCSLDDLAGRTGLPADRLLTELLALELGGRVAPLPGGLYQRLDDGPPD